MTLKQIYLASKTYLQSLAYIKSVRLFNNQTSELAQYKLNEYPVVFVQLLPGTITTMPGYVQRIELSFSAIVVQNRLDTDDPAHLDIIDYLNQDLTGEDFTTDPNNPILFSPLQLTDIKVDTDHDKVIIHTLSFAAHYLAKNEREVFTVSAVDPAVELTNDLS